jgi:ribosome biogenesis GTPase
MAVMWDPAALGWDDGFAAHFAPHAAEGLSPGRVTVEHQHLYEVASEHGALLAEVAGRLRHRATSKSDYPVAGDWVALSPRPDEGRATIHAVLPRRGHFARKVKGEAADAQLLAANVDVVFLMMGLDRDFNPRRLERYLALAGESGARPVVLLTKPDLCADSDARRLEIETLAAGVPVYVVAPKHGLGLEALVPHLGRGRTLALLGSSGVGKSTLVNRLLGEERLATREVRLSDQRGRHTTTRRELLSLPGGALVIDTPGMRELQLWDANLETSFDDLAQLVGGCRFSDCRHDSEPGCAVREAVEAGRLPAGRLESYRKLEGELESLAARRDLRAQAEQKRRWRSIHRLARKHRPRE